MLFDAHAHVNEASYTDEYRDKLASEISSSDVKYVVDGAYDLNSSLMAVENSMKFPWCYATVGIHPQEASKIDDAMIERIDRLTEEPKVVAVGEIGLDYHYGRDDLKKQHYWLRRQIRLAEEKKLPIVIHSRDADDDMMRILKQEGAFSSERQSCFPKRPGPDGQLLPDSRVLLHCFSGSADLARQYVKLGATISICGPVTFKNNRKTVEVVDRTPIEFLTSETDSPYLAPEPLRGKTNKPTYVEYVVRRIAVIKRISFEEAAEATCRNGKRFFDIT